jgi:hypothetical protein
VRARTEYGSRDRGTASAAAHRSSVGLPTRWARQISVVSSVVATISARAAWKVAASAGPRAPERRASPSLWFYRNRSRHSRSNRVVGRIAVALALRTAAGRFLRGRPAAVFRPLRPGDRGACRRDHRQVPTAARRYLTPSCPRRPQGATVRRAGLSSLPDGARGLLFPRGGRLVFQCRAPARPSGRDVRQRRGAPHDTLHPALDGHLPDGARSRT